MLAQGLAHSQSSYMCCVNGRGVLPVERRHLRLSESQPLSLCPHMGSIIMPPFDRFFNHHTVPGVQ